MPVPFLFLELHAACSLQRSEGNQTAYTRRGLAAKGRVVMPLLIPGMMARLRYAMPRRVPRERKGSQARTVFCLGCYEKRRGMRAVAHELVVCVRACCVRVRGGTRTPPRAHICWSVCLLVLGVLACPPRATLHELLQLLCELRLERSFRHSAGDAERTVGEGQKQLGGGKGSHGVARVSVSLSVLSSLASSHQPHLPLSRYPQP